jgi:diguanylate cyclase (GGDEF)-like protein/PAS domain S-box-containing protein
MSDQKMLQFVDQIAPFDELGPEEKRAAFDRRGQEILRLNRLIEERTDERVSLQILIDQVPDYLFVKDAQSRFIVANKSLAADYGRDDPSELFGLTDFDLHPRAVAQQFYDIEQKIVTTGQPMFDLDEAIVDPDGVRKSLSTTKVPFYNNRGRTVGVVGIARNVTARKQAEILRDGQAHILEMIATNAPLTDVLDYLVRLIEAQTEGVCASVLLLSEDGVHLAGGVAPSLPVAYLKAIENAPIGPNAGSCGAAAYRRAAVFVADIATDPLWAERRTLAAAHGLRSCWSTPILSHQGGVLGTFALHSREARHPSQLELQLASFATRIAGIAIERKLAEERIRFMATHDALTGLPNRALLKDRLTQALLYAKRYDRWVTVMFVDLDNFKFVNDSLGHNAGDELLKTVAQRMVNAIRSTDTVVRLGGDEFVVLFLDQSKNSSLISLAMQKVRAAIAQPISVEGHDFQVTCSIGLANYPNDGLDAETLLANADAAMYRAKEIGRDNFQFYRPDLNVKVHEKFLLQKDLRVAIARSELLLHYQPQVDLRTGSVFAVEALVRWRHPLHGMIPPIKFIPMAEETGLIVPVGEWVLREACRQNKAWQRAGLPPMAICVNVSARQFKEKNWVAYVASTLRETGLSAEYLELEITESLIMQDVEQAVATMKELQTLGVKLAIDDFGTGYSSLAALKRFPVARLKIDKSFIGDIPRDDNDRAVASAVISLGQKLNLRVIAEGVETDAQVAFLRANDCDEMQGYHFSKPVGAVEIEALLRAHRATREMTSGLA